MTEKKPSERQLDLTAQRADQNRQHLRGLLLAGASSPPTQTADGAYFDALRDRVRESPTT